MIELLHLRARDNDIAQIDGLVCGCNEFFGEDRFLVSKRHDLISSAGDQSRNSYAPFVISLLKTLMVWSVDVRDKVCIG